MRRGLTAAALTAVLLAGCATPNADSDTTTSVEREADVRRAAVAEADLTAYVAVAGVT